MSSFPAFIPSLPPQSVSEVKVNLLTIAPRVAQRRRWYDRRAPTSTGTFLGKPPLAGAVHLKR